MISARGCHPLRCMLFSHREKTKTKLGSQCGPGGRKREKEDGERTSCVLGEEEVKDMENQSNPSICVISLCKMGTAIVLPLCWGKKIQGCGGLFPWEKEHEGGLASPCPFPLFYKLQRDLAALCLSSLP